MSNVYGMQSEGGQWVIAGSHECGLISCRHPATVAVFGIPPETGQGMARLNVCRPHMARAMRELAEPWTCALLADRERGEYCPHCGARDQRQHADGCVIGATFRPPHPEHDRDGCEACNAYFERRPGPVG